MVLIHWVLVLIGCSTWLVGFWVGSWGWWWFQVYVGRVYWSGCFPGSGFRFTWVGVSLATWVWVVSGFVCGVGFTVVVWVFTGFWMGLGFVVSLWVGLGVWVVFGGFNTLGFSVNWV